MATPSLACPAPGLKFEPDERIALLERALLERANITSSPSKSPKLSLQTRHEQFKNQTANDGVTESLATTAPKYLQGEQRFGGETYKSLDGSLVITPTSAATRAAGFGYDDPLYILNQTVPTTFQDGSGSSRFAEQWKLASGIQFPESPGLWLTTYAPAGNEVRYALAAPVIGPPAVPGIPLDDYRAAYPKMSPDGSNFGVLNVGRRYTSANDPSIAFGEYYFAVVGNLNSNANSPNVNLIALLPPNTEQKRASIVGVSNSSGAGSEPQALIAQYYVSLDDSAEYKTQLVVASGSGRARALDLQEIFQRSNIAEKLSEIEVTATSRDLRSILIQSLTGDGPILLNGDPVTGHYAATRLQKETTIGNSKFRFDEIVPLSVQNGAPFADDYKSIVTAVGLLGQDSMGRDVLRSLIYKTAHDGTVSTQIVSPVYADQNTIVVPRSLVNKSQFLPFVCGDGRLYDATLLLPKEGANEAAEITGLIRNINTGKTVVLDALLKDPSVGAQLPPDIQGIYSVSSVEIAPVPEKDGRFLTPPRIGYMIQALGSRIDKNSDTGYKIEPLTLHVERETLDRFFK